MSPIPRSSHPAHLGPVPIPGAPFHVRGRGAVPILALALCLAAGCGASNVAGPAPVAETELPPYYSVEFDPTFATPRFVRNLHATGAARPGEPAPFSDAEALQILRRFVIRYAVVFKLRPGVDDFVTTWSSSCGGANCLKVQQTYLGLPVENMGYGVSVMASREVASIIGRFMPDIRVRTLPLVPAARAGATAIETLLPTVVHLGSGPTLTIAVLEDGPTPRLAWSAIVVEPASRWSWTVRVDAQSGIVLSVAPNFIID